MNLEEMDIALLDDIITEFKYDSKYTFTKASSGWILCKYNNTIFCAVAIIYENILPYIIVAPIVAPTNDDMTNKYDIGSPDCFGLIYSKIKELKENLIWNLKSH